MLGVWIAKTPDLPAVDTSASFVFAVLLCSRRYVGRPGALGVFVCHILQVAQK